MIFFFSINKIFFSTSENLVVFIWYSIENFLSNGKLHEVKLYETEKNIVVYRGESREP